MESLVAPQKVVFAVARASLASVTPDSAELTRAWATATGSAASVVTVACDVLGLDDLLSLPQAEANSARATRAEVVWRRTPTTLRCVEARPPHPFRGG